MVIENKMNQVKKLLNILKLSLYLMIIELGQRVEYNDRKKRKEYLVKGQEWHSGQVGGKRQVQIGRNQVHESQKHFRREVENSISQHREDMP